MITTVTEAWARAVGTGAGPEVSFGRQESITEEGAHELRLSSSFLGR